MKLKELFDKYTFDEILPYLRMLEPKRLDAMHEFREAYDLLRHMDLSKEDCGEVRIELSDDEDEADRYISVHPLEGVRWNVGLAKEVVVAEELQLEGMEIAARCLWSITFWGFEDELDPEERNPLEYPPEQMNKYDVALYKIRLSQWKRTTPRRYRSKARRHRITSSYCEKSSC